MFECRNSHCVPPNDVKVSAIHKLLAYKTAPNKVIALFTVESQTSAVLDKKIELLLADQTERTSSDFIWGFGKLPFPEYLGKYSIKIGKVSAKIHEIWENKGHFWIGNDFHNYKVVKMAK